MGEDTLEEAVDALGAQMDASIRQGDVHPGETAPVLLAGPDRILARDMRWGFVPAQGKGLLINARAETALQKPTFSESMLERRCVMPADSFYEWDAHRQMVTFRHPEDPFFYLAGCWRLFEGTMRFVILTREANRSMLPVHPRMPLLFDRFQASEWIRPGADAESLLRIEMPQLRMQRAFTQTSLFDAGEGNA